jgi:serine/threonine protein kinase
MAEFEPIPNEMIKLDDEYRFTPHPVVPSMVFGQEGRKGTVYQLSKNGEKFAFKVFKPSFRDNKMVENTHNLSKMICEGFEANKRICFTKPSYSALINDFPELEFAVLMPWITGSTWFDVIVNKTPLIQSQCWALAKNTARVLASIEKNGYAHCDVASANVIVNIDTGKVSFIDVEDMFGNNFPDPSAYPMGTDGYQHKNSRRNQKGQWCKSGDRFSAAILLIEMLTWCNADIRKMADDEHFFSINELQDVKNERYHSVQNELKKSSQKITECFERAWKSQSLDECPSLTEWAEALELPIVSKWNPIIAPPPPAAPFKGWTGKVTPISPPPPYEPHFNPLANLTLPPPVFLWRQSEKLFWKQIEGAEGYKVQESSTIDFINATEYYNGNQLNCNIQKKQIPMFYRVCGYSANVPGRWSNIVKVDDLST